MRALSTLSETDNRVKDDCFLEDEGDCHQQVFKFREVPPFVALIVKIRMTQYTYRSSGPEVFCKKAVLRNFTKFTGKHLCQSLFLIKLQA